MPKKNQVPYFHAVRRPNGEVDYYWKPTRKLRQLGYANHKLPDGYRAAIDAAIVRNEAVAAAMGRVAGVVLQSSPATAARSVRAALREYEASKAFTGLAPASQSNYRLYLREIDSWCTLPSGESILIAELDRQMILDLRDVLNEDPRHHRRTMMFRVLGVFLQFCEDKGWIKAHPGRNIRAQGAPARKQRLLREDLQLLVDAAIALELPDIVAGVPLGFFTMQREADLLAATGFKLQALTDISAEARRVLAGSDGRVLGLVLEQEKTDTPVAIPLIGESRAAIEAVFAGARGQGVVGTHLIPDPVQPGACRQWRFQTDFRAVVDHVVAELEQQPQPGQVLARIRKIQYRDLRRSGMCWMRDLGVPVPLIAAISGHSIQETQKILDTYMPRDTRAAAEGMAMAVTRQAERDAANEKEGQG